MRIMCLFLTVYHDVTPRNREESPGGMEMKDLNEQEKANITQIQTLLLAFFKGANVTYCKCRLGGQKFKIEAAAQKMFLCVSQEYLSDQRESRIRRDFELYSVPKTLSMNSERCFLLGNNGMQQIQAQDVAS